MKLGVPWSVKGIRPEARETAKEAARRSGMSLGEWLNAVIINSAGQEGVDPSAIDGDEGGYGSDEIATVHARLDDLTRRIDRHTRSGPEAYAPRRRPGPEQSAEFIGRLDQFTGAVKPAAPAGTWSAGLDRAVAEIAARQRALNGETPLQVAQQVAQQTVPPPDSARVPLPAQDLSGLEQQLRNITNQIETLRRPGVEEAINALRGELAEIAHALSDAMPRQAIDAIERQIQSLSHRIAEGKQAGVDGGALGGIEHGLAEVRDALRTLTPAENLIGFNEAVGGLAHKIDLIVAQKDPATLAQLEGAITTLRGISTHIASNETVGRLASDVAMLAEKVDRIANSGAAGAALSSLEQRIGALSDALAERSQNGGTVPPRLEALVESLAGKIEQIQLSRGDGVALGHLEDRIVKLVEKLDASDSRLGHLEAIERGLADLLIHIEDMRAQKGEGGIRDAAPAGVDALKHDIARTQNELEAVHGTLGHVVDRLAMIEQNIRGEPRQQPPGQDPAADLLQQPVGRVAARLVADTTVAAPVAPPVAAKRPAPPAANRPPIDPDLPPDQPIEPGSGPPRGRANSAARIAASEAALGDAGPPDGPNPGGKSGFIAAARRAAQAAADDPAPRTPLRADRKSPNEHAAPTLGSKLANRVKSLFIAASIIAIVIGGLHLGSNYFEIAQPGAPGGKPAQTARKDAPNNDAKDPARKGDKPATTDTVDVTNTAARPLPGTVSSSAQFGIPAAPATRPLNPSLPEAAIRSVPELNGMFTNKPAADITGSLPSSAGRRPPRPAIAPPATTDGDKIPIAIGGPALRHAAAAGEAAAAYEVAVRYAEGRGVPVNLEDSARWFERAARDGLAPAQFRLASLYEKGQGVKKDLGQARRLYSAAAAKGNGKAMHNLAVLYAEGIDGKPDYAAAAQWFGKAAARGISDSQYNLGILCARGLGTEKNLGESYKWFALAAAQGDKEAGKKRDDVAAQLDAKALAAAQHAVKTWTAEPQPDAAVNVPVPPAGWDQTAPGPTPAAPRSRISGAFEIGKR